jgi:hypothetical protein
MLIKTNDASFMRDEDNTALINTNKTAYDLYKQQRSTIVSNQALKAEVDMLKQDLNDIKQLLGQIAQNVGINR